MPAGYGNDDDNDKNSNDEDVVGLTSKRLGRFIYAILFFWKWGPKAEE